MLNTVPGFIPWKHLFIQEDSKKLNRNEGWLSVIDVDSDLVNEVGPVQVADLVGRHDIYCCCRAKKILLFHSVQLTGS